MGITETKLLEKVAERGSCSVHGKRQTDAAHRLHDKRLAIFINCSGMVWVRAGQGRASYYKQTVAFNGRLLAV